jgi:hypothetical protein
MVEALPAVLEGLPTEQRTLRSKPERTSFHATMNYHPPDRQRTKALNRLLRHNEADCIRHNISIHVDEVNEAHSVALCSVQQRQSGPFRHRYSQQELVDRGERALHPLQELGLLPLLTIRITGPSPFPVPAHPWNLRSLVVWMQDIWHWSGAPLAREASDPLQGSSDPFGGKQAVRIARPSFSEPTGIVLPTA